jgi:subtilase family serine protease
MRYPHLALAFAALALAACSNHGATSMLPNSPLTSQAVSPAVAEAGFATGVSEQSLGAVHFVVGLPLRNSIELDRVLNAISDPDSPEFRHFLTRETFLERYAPSATDLVAVARDLRSAGFNVSIMDQAVAVGGTQAHVERYFGTRFARNANGQLAPASAMRLPSALAVRHASVIGLSGTPPMRTFSRSIPAPSGLQPDNGNSPIGPYFPIDLKEAYKMPSIQEATGRGAKIAIIIDNPIEPSDMKAFFKFMDSALPKIAIKKIDGGGGRFNPNGDGQESSLDVEQSGGIAPGAAITVNDIASLSDTDIYDGYQAAVKDGATVVNSSFGGCEQALTQSELTMFDSLYQQGIASGMTFVASSGDHGAYQCGFNSQGPLENKIGVSWPADSIYVVAVGGTNLQTVFVSGTTESTYVKESANKDIGPQEGGKYWGSGGGYSTLYKRPKFQNGFVTKSGRGMPDIALHMGGLGFSGNECAAKKCAPGDSSDAAIVGGNKTLEVGTSASGPDIVGLIALGTEIQGTPLGDIHALLYMEAKHPGLLRRGIKGNNGLPTTSGAWDPVLGLGTPISASAMVGGKTVAGTPGTSTNP